MGLEKPHFFITEKERDQAIQTAVKDGRYYSRTTLERAIFGKPDGTIEKLNLTKLATQDDMYVKQTYPIDGKQVFVVIYRSMDAFRYMPFIREADRENFLNLKHNLREIKIESTEGNNKLEQSALATTPSTTPSNTIQEEEVKNKVEETASTRGSHKLPEITTATTPSTTPSNAIQEEVKTKVEETASTRGSHKLPEITTATTPSTTPSNTIQEEEVKNKVEETASTRGSHKLPEITTATTPQEAPSDTYTQEEVMGKISQPDLEKIQAYLLLSKRQYAVADITIDNKTCFAFCLGGAKEAQFFKNAPARQRVIAASGRYNYETLHANIYDANGIIEKNNLKQLKPGTFYKADYKIDNQDVFVLILSVVLGSFNVLDFSSDRERSEFLNGPEGKNWKDEFIPSTHPKKEMGTGPVITKKETGPDLCTFDEIRHKISADLCKFLKQPIINNFSESQYDITQIQSKDKQTTYYLLYLGESDGLPLIYTSEQARKNAIEASRPI